MREKDKVPIPSESSCSLYTDLHIEFTTKFSILHYDTATIFIKLTTTTHV